MPDKVLVYSRSPKALMVRIGERYELMDAADDEGDRCDECGVTYTDEGAVEGPWHELACSLYVPGPRSPRMDSGYAPDGCENSEAGNYGP